jgi:hypothetical protein
MSLSLSMLNVPWYIRWDKIMPRNLLFEVKIASEYCTVKDESVWIQKCCMVMIITAFYIPTCFTVRQAFSSVFCFIFTYCRCVWGSLYKFSHLDIWGFLSSPKGSWCSDHHTEITHNLGGNMALTWNMKKKRRRWKNRKGENRSSGNLGIYGDQEDVLQGGFYELALLPKPPIMC